MIGAASTDLTEDQLADVAALPYVAAVTADSPVFATSATVAPTSTLDITNATIGLGSLASRDARLTGAGVTVAVIDSGTDDLPDLDAADGSSRIVGWADFVGRSRWPYDDGGHGTFVAGLIAGNGAASRPVDQGGRATQQFRGVAPGAGIVSLKVLDRYGQGTASALIAAIQWTIRHRDQYGIRVINLSVEGAPTCSAAFDPIDLAAEAAWKAGIVVVCTAGNEGSFGPGGILSPGNDPYVITVGALDTAQTATQADDAVASWSSMGPSMFDEFAKPDLVAPGVHVVSLRDRWSYLDRTYPQNRVPVSSYIPGAPPWWPESYFVMSGTSTAAPIVSGVVALMLQKDPTLKPDDVKTRLMASADALVGAPPKQQGAGEVDVPGALAQTGHATGPALSADLGDGHTVLPPDVEVQWQKYAWSKYAWSKYGWSKYAWSKYAWSKYAWSKYAWSKYAWSVLIDGR
jgi:serine protease AprX